MTSIAKYLKTLNTLPRVTLDNVRDLPWNWDIRKKNRRGQHGGNKRGFGHKGREQRMRLVPLGVDIERGKVPFYLKIPREPYNDNYEQYGTFNRMQLVPLTLLHLQRLLDTGRLDPKHLIDLTSIALTSTLTFLPDDGHQGFNLTEEGLDEFAACVNLELQWASEPVIAAVERNGGVITTRYVDPISVRAMRDPAAFFARGEPVPRAKLPPTGYLLDYYSNAANRGYLADPAAVQRARLELSQKYGYTLPDVGASLSRRPWLSLRKHPRQIFLGLEPGDLVSLADRSIYRPTEPDLLKLYRS